MPKLEFSHISKSYYAGMNQEVRALIDCTGTVSTDEFVVVVGANGSGKSTFLEILSGSLRPDTGKIHLSEDTLQQDWLALKPFKRNKRVKFVRQDPKLGTVSSFTLAENLLLSKLSRSKPRFFDFKLVDKIGHDSRTTELHEIFTGTLKLRADELSYGQRQVFNFEMLKNLSFDFLFLDEPTASLDKKNARLYIEALTLGAKNSKFGIVMVTHDFEIASMCGDRLIVFKDGCIEHDICGIEKAKLEPKEIIELCGY